MQDGKQDPNETEEERARAQARAARQFSAEMTLIIERLYEEDKWYYEREIKDKEEIEVTE